MGKTGRGGETGRVSLENCKDGKEEVEKSE